MNICNADLFQAVYKLLYICFSNVCVGMKSHDLFIIHTNSIRMLMLEG